MQGTASTRVKLRAAVCYPAIIMLGILAGCGDERGGVSSPVKEGAAEGSEEAGGQEWSTTEWVMQRGAPDLTGRLPDRVIRDPEIEWSVQLDAPIAAEAAIANGAVFVGTLTGMLYALEVATGEVRWSFEAGDTIESAPTVEAGRVMFGANDGVFYCLEESDGAVIWKEEGADKIIGGATVVEGPDGSRDRVVYNGHEGVVRCRLIEDGMKVWDWEAETNIGGTPGLVEGKFLVFGGCAAVVHVLNLEDGTFANEVVTDAEVLSWVASVGPMIYFGNHANQVVAANAFGEELTWVYEDRDFPFFGSPAVDEERVYMGSRDKHLHAINRKTGAPAWKFKTGGRVDGSAIVFDDAVVFGSGGGRLYALDPKDGGEIWRLDLGEGIMASPAFAGGRLVIGGDDGTLFSIKAGNPKDS